MEITKEQLLQVEVYLQHKDFDFIDLNVEVLDHIISDIESLLVKKYSFDNAFKITILKWEKHFKETSSFYLGFHYSESKIVVKKAIKMFKPFYFLYLAAYILPVIFLKLVPIQIAIAFAESINSLLFCTSLVMLSYLVFIFFKTVNSKVKTTYRFILKTQYLGLVLLITGATMGVFRENGEMNPVFTGFICGGFAIVFICHHFYKKHIEAIKKCKIL
ncbi:hypothetical protein PI23P_03682 [Polaribacter irgensii 23-P]|uniref:Uncharacterized protein n=1 Tax=Polaribacter irgensii 23-P TaxID=313594 RepID=A4BX73_9FLAO|nr:hypothetical protein [Polaribacter irgensii]EAR13564.1 hypothetical protein PI23P_03682 [Polaribacter irgensii 23-P]